MAAGPDTSWKHLHLFSRSEFAASLEGAPLDVEAGLEADAFLKSALDKGLERAGHRANFRILIDSSLASWAWEAMSYAGTAVALSPRLSLVRQSRFSFQEAREQGPALSVLIVTADPGMAHHGELAFLEKEVDAVERALQAGECRPIQTSVQRYCTPGALRRLLSQNQVDVFHFVGHGEVGATGPALLFEGANPGEPARVFADDLAEWLREAGVRMAVFGGCSTQELASVVADAGVTATLGFSGRISDAAAMSFARALYASLAQRQSLEDALLGARLAVQGIDESWRKPILHLAAGTPRNWGLFAMPSDVAPGPVKRHNLSYDARPFIGRTEERRELAHRLVDLGERLVSVTGMGGMGKTRLSRQMTGELAETFPDGAWFVECDQLESRQEIVTAAGVALELEDKSEEALMEWGANRSALLVFDCFERVVAQAQLLEDLLLAAPGISVLVTSRIVLGLPREHEYQLSPMALKGGRGQSADGLALFEEAARHTRRDFKLSARDVPLARKICQMLEGVPLAIVLAAGRLRHVSLAELARYVEERPLDILRTTRDPSGRHGSLTTVVGDSFALIDDVDRRNLVALSAFGGAFSARDAEVVLGHGQVLDVIGRLRDNSLIEAQVSSEVSRYKLLDTVRDYLALISADPAIAETVEAARNRHVDLMLEKSEQAEALISEGRWKVGTSLIVDDLPNFRAAVRRALAMDNRPAIRQFGLRLARTLFESGMWADFELLAQAALDLAVETKDSELETAMLGLMGALAARQDKADLCLERWNRRAEVCEESGNLAGLTDSLTDLASFAYELGDVETCRRHLIRGLLLAKKERRYEFVATFVVDAAQLALDEGDRVRARRRTERTRRYLERAVEIEPTLYVMQRQILLFRDMGEADLAMETAGRLIRLSTERHRPVHLGWALLQMAQMYEERADMERAMTAAQAAYKLHAEASSRYLQRAKQLITRFKKELGETAERKFAETSAMPWRKLVGLLDAATGPGQG